jgi:adenylosuccinate synthase
VNVIGNGVIIDPFIFFKEIDKLRSAGIRPEQNLLISRRAHLILPTHRVLDAALEASMGASKIGSTLKGIGPTYTDKYARNGLRIGCIADPAFRSKYDMLRKKHLELIAHLGFDHAQHLLDGLGFAEYEEKWFEAIGRLSDFRLIDSEVYLNRALDEGKSVLAEGAQGTLLDVDFGSYPFVTSSNTISAGVCSGLGISPHRVGTIYGVFKAYCTRVGSGPFPTELSDNDGEKLRTGGHEFGSTTGRPRRCGWLDLPALNYSVMINGVDSLIMMKADVLDEFPVIRVCTHYKSEGEMLDSIPYDLGSESFEPVYEELTGWHSSLKPVTSMEMMPGALKDYIAFIEKSTGLPVDIVSTGPDRVQTLSR